MFQSGRHLLAAASLWLAISSAAFAQSGGMTAQTGASLANVEAILTEFIDDLAALKFDDAFRAMSILGPPYNGDQFRKTVSGLEIIGKTYYYEKIIDKNYGKTGKDVIFKIVSENNIYFFRFVLHQRTENNWLVINLAVQTETQAPLPKVWGQVLP